MRVGLWFCFIGQVFYTYIGAPVYSAARIQHEEANNALLCPDITIEPKTEIFIFPIQQLIM
jgi:hypothetical protein